jgi:cell division protein FtsL
VHTPSPYESAIAAKLQQLPVPDMADGIWASIEMQLDADLSSGDDDASPQKPTKRLPGMGKGFYLSVLAAVIVAIVLIYKANKNHSNKSNSTPVPAKIDTLTPVAGSDQSSNMPAQKKDSSKPTVVNKKDSSNSLIPGNRISVDSVGQLVVPFNKPDSSAVIKGKPLLPSFDSVPPPLLIKPRGVKGITDNDYRIQESKKDSGKKGN